MNQTLKPLDLAKLQEVIAIETEVHQKIVQLAYDKNAIETAEVEMKASLADLISKRTNLNKLLTETYGQISSLDRETGAYELAGQNQQMSPNPQTEASAKQETIEEAKLTD